TSSSTFASGPSTAGASRWCTWPPRWPPGAGANIGTATIASTSPRSAQPAPDEALPAVALQAGAALRPDDGGVACPGGKDEALAGAQLDRRPIVADEEGDRPLGADEQLRVAVLVPAVPIAGAVAPRRRAHAGLAQGVGGGLDARPCG